MSARVLAFALAVAIASPTVADAKKALETARTSLAKAVERIQKDPPSNADLEAASSAVAALKAAIDAGAELEPTDLDYAKAALAARKDLRTQREYVEERRAKIHIHDSRRDIDRALASLDDAVKKISGGSASGADFDRARTGAGEVEKVLEAARAFAAQDSSFASYVADATATLSRQRETIAMRAIDESRRLLSVAMNALGNKEPSEAQFDAADRAVAACAKLIEEAKALETKSKEYRAYADGARQEVSSAQKRIDAMWTEIGLARLKSEIEPLREELVQSGRSLRGKKPSEEQLAEARTAAIVVRKVLEKYGHLTARSRPIVSYVSEVKKSLVEIELDLQKRSVEAARENVNAAIAAIGGRNAAEEAFKAANEALKEAQKILTQGEPLAKEDRAYAAYANEVKKRFQEAESKIATRRSELEVAAQRLALDEARGDLTRALRSLEKKAPTDEQFGEANNAQIVLEKALEGTRMRDPSLMKYADEMRALSREAKTTITKRKLEVDVDRQRARVEAGRAEVAGLLKNGGTDEVAAAVEKLKKTLAEGNELTKKDRSYDTYDVEVKKRLQEVEATIAQRREAIDTETQKSKVSPGLTRLAGALAAMDGLGPKGPSIEAADAALKSVETALLEGAWLEKKLPAYAAYARDARKTAESAKARIAKRKLELAASEGRAKVEEKMGSAKASAESAKQLDAGDREVETAVESFNAAKAAVEANASIEAQDRGYAAVAARARKDLERLEEEIDVAKQARAFRRVTLDVLMSGVASANAAAKAKELEAQKQQYEKAMTDFKSCRTAGERMLDQNPALSSSAVLVEGQKMAATELLASCKARAEAAEEPLKKVLGLLAFEEGPKRSFESGAVLLRQQKSSEALAQFEECVSSGKILQHRNPELKDQKFEVAGGTVTLSELVAKCTAECKRIRGK